MGPLLDSLNSPDIFHKGVNDGHAVLSAPIDGVTHPDGDRLEPVAIVGFSFRFPGQATDCKGFWEMMMDKRCAASESPGDRINVSGWYHPDRRRRGQYTARGAHFLKEDVSVFDAPFFSLSADEAAALDPQQRHLLEVTYRALENAGIPMEKAVGTQTSVHVGCFGSDYRLMACKDVEMTADYDVVGVKMSMNANRLSWFFDFRGTSMNIDTACSSSLIALDLACQGLRNGETEMGIVAGTNLILSPDMMQVFSNVNMLSPDSRSYSFDHRANGYGRGEGTGTLVIKRLTDAIRDGDTIRAVIRSAGSNQDGLTPSGIMQPSGVAQAKLIRDTYRKAGLSMEPTRFFEAHGTGTPVGDPIECNALGEAFRGVRSVDDPLIVGAVKSNIGHLEGASGIAAVIKAIVVLESGLIPPNANFERLNPKIDLEYLCLKLPLELTPWPTRGLRRSGIEDLRHVDEKTSPVYQAPEKPVLGFVFTGQGAQWAGMGRELFKFPVFRNSFMECENALRGFGCTWSLRDTILSNDELSKIDHPDVAQPANTALQIALVDLLRSVAVQPAAVIGHSSGEIAAAYALGALSIAEAMQIAYFRGVCAAKLAQSKGPTGQMLATGLSEMEADVYVEKVAMIHGHRGLEVACINSHKSVTVSGDANQIDTLKSILDIEKVFARKLRTPVAYHSYHMRDVASAYQECLQDLHVDADRVCDSIMISSVTGEKVDYETLRSPEYWVDNLVSPVQFSRSFLQICSESGNKVRKKLDLSHRAQLGVNILLEIGPHATLQGPIRDLLEALAWGQDVNYYPALRRGQNAANNFLSALGYLHCSGCSVDLGRANKLADAVQKHPRLLIDLPEYPFNHSVSYWRESRISKQSRLGSQGRLDLLGKPVVDWNPLEARWRHHIRCSEMPWVEDHVINGSLIYPAAGMLVMAIEAANQIADPDQNVVGFQLKDVRFQHALTIPVTADGIETNLHLRKLNDSGWSEFRLFSYEHDNWQENCYGCIRVEYEAAGTSTERCKDLDDCLEQDALIAQSCTHEFNREELYQCLHESGFEFGSTFQTIHDGKCSVAQQARSPITVYPWPVDQYPQPHVIHPTTLDGILHLSAAALSEGGRSKIPTAIPTGVRSLWVAKEGLSWPTVHTVHACASIKTLTHRGHEFDLFVMDELRTKVLTRVDGLQSTIVADNTRKSTDIAQEKLTSYYVNRVPDLGMLTTDQLVTYCLRTNSHAPEPLGFFRDLNFILYKFLNLALDGLGELLPTDLAPHIHRYTDWARLQCIRYQAGQLPLSRPEWAKYISDPSYFEEVCNRVAAANSLGKAYVHTGRNLLPILRGEQDPLRFLFKDDMMVNFYREVNNRPVCFEPWGVYLRTQAQKNPMMRILEIGAGTGSTTDHIMHALSVGSGVAENRPLYMTYDYTDISPAFFEQAAERYKMFPRINFTALDISEDPSKQGFDLGSYDLIIAANVLHATPDITVTMRNVRKLLKPRGKVMLYEDTRPDIVRAGFIAGLMEGWWAGKEDYRAWGAALTTPRWDKVLKDTGFTGVDAEFPEFLDPECQETAILVSTASALPATDRMSPPTIYFVLNPSSAVQRDIYECASRLLRAQYRESVIESGDLKQCVSWPSLANTTLVFLHEIESPLLSNVDCEAFRNIQHLVNCCHAMMWITAGGGPSPKRPEYSIVDGWTRTLRSEKANRRVCTLALDIDSDVTDDQIVHIVRVLTDSVLDNEQEVYEPEIVEVDGMLHVVRIVPDGDLTDDLYEASLPQQAASKLLGDVGPVKLVCATPGLLDTLCWIEDDDAFEPLPPDEVEVEVKSVGLNFKGSQFGLGKDVEMELGQECAGVVTRAGELSGLQPGDRVVAFGPGMFRTIARGKRDTICRIPDRMTFSEAASMAVQFGAAWHAIIDIGRLQTGETILIHAGASGTGQAAIQIAQVIGAEIYATASSQETQILINEYNIPADHIFHSEGTTFVRGLMRMTRGQGVDMIVNTLADEMLLASWECIAAYGHLVHIGSNRDGLSNSNPLMAQSCRQASFTHFNSYVWMRDKPNAAKQAIEGVLNLFDSEKIHIRRPLKVESVGNIEKVLASVQSGELAGKTVVEMTPQAQVPTVLKTKVPFQLNSSATYIIAGGLGGLGRTIARWMAARGARYLVLLGRSGAKTQAAFELIEELEAQGVRVTAPACDVIDTASVTQVMQEIQRTMPPIKGCVQGSMVLRDQMFSEMSYEDWRAVVECKALGSWNLEINLPQDLDFFVLLSSASAVIGLTGQSNYAAGNSYMDGFARYRVANGRKAVSLDLGAMVDDGLLVETPGFLEKVLGYGSLAPVSRAQFLGVLDYYCDPSRPLLTPGTAQMVLGISGGGDRYLESTLVDKSLFCRLKLDNVSNNTVVEEGDRLNFHWRFVEATSLQEGREIVAKALIDKLTHSYRVLPEDVEVDMHAPLYTFRIDSLLAVELCNWIAKEFVAELAVLEVMGEAEGNVSVLYVPSDRFETKRAFVSSSSKKELFLLLVAPSYLSTVLRAAPTDIKRRETLDVRTLEL
ncbi:hypothetical protein BBP40_005578 [Aspergillus hancockii]|nr:hypothetical protein BBP40_005578 [Aspergillus hancockii]